ncbi:hypothetical protein EJP80_03295 [Rahnella aquatilis]|nr:hypothetical protein EJP80_03295 [Rahnella aquatilis]
MKTAITKLSEHSSVYRGFTITRLPRNKLNRFTRYRVIQNNQSFGLFDGQALATSFIDDLHNQR